MGDKYADVIFQARSSDYRRRVGGRRLFREQEYLDHNPERRVNMIGRRIIRYSRESFPEIMNTFCEKAL